MVNDECINNLNADLVGSAQICTFIYRSHNRVVVFIPLELVPGTAWTGSAE